MTLMEYSITLILVPMNWDIEYTDEFGNWWEELTESEQSSVAASVKLLGQSAQACVFRIAVQSMARGMVIYGNCASSMAGDRIACSMRLIQDAARCF